MEHQLPALPYAKDALAPHMSAETFDYHYSKHHQAYVTNGNKLIEGTEFATKSLVDIVKATAGKPDKAGPLFYRPSVVGDVSPDMSIVREEIFGPLLPVKSTGSAPAFEAAKAMQRGVTAIQLHQLLVRAALRHRAVLEHHQLAGFASQIEDHQTALAQLVFGALLTLGLVL